MGKRVLAICMMICLMIGFPVMVLADGEDEIERAIRVFQSETKCTAVSVVTYDHGELRYYEDREGLFQIGSMTKAFTGLAIQKLIQEGKLKGEDRVSDFLPWFKAYYGGEKVEITIDQLMTQTSGFTNEEAKYPSASKGQTLKEWAKGISGKKLCSKPGEKYAYSNVNYNLLGVILEEVTGRSYREYMEAEILKPLGLTETYVGEPAESKTPKYVGEAGTSNDNGNETRNGDSEGSMDRARVIEGSRLMFRKAFSYPLSVREGAIPAGYFYSNVTDLGRWMEIWLGEAEVSEEWQEIISEIKERLRETGDYYGGWERFENGIIGHSGGTPNYSSRILFSESEGVGACVLTNLNVAASTDSLCNGMFAVLAGGEMESVQSDVWTIFDRIFTGLCILGILVLPVCIWGRKRGMLVAVGIVDAAVIAVLAITLPFIFGADLVAILFTWAPFSLAGFFVIYVMDAAACVFRVRMMGKHENHKETSGGAAPHGDR